MYILQSSLTFSEQRVFGHFSAGLGRFHYLEKNTVPETRASKWSLIGLNRVLNFHQINFFEILINLGEKLK